MSETIQAARRAQRHPFGNPDGARADLNELMHTFIGIGGESAHLADPAYDLTGRIIVGRMGAGKTVYLRRSQALAAADPATYADHVRNDLPSTDDIVQVAHRHESRVLAEVWRGVWHRAILRALVSHLLFAPQLRGTVHEEDRELLVNELGGLLGNPTAPRSAYSEVSTIIRKHQTRNSLARYLSDPRWNDVSWHLAAILREAPPVYFHLDAVDEQFAHAPMYWLQFQKGLFHAVMELLREPEFGSRLHVVACMRDIVYSHVLRSEHAGRYRDEPHIRVLEWEGTAIRQLLRAKIDRLGQRYRMDPDVPGIAGWLGTAEIDNVARGVRESVEDYILRHTRLLPRDVVVIGNVLSREVADAKARGQRELDPRVLRRCVGRAARDVADMQLRVCANQIAADAMPPNAVAHGISNVYLGDTEYARGLVEELCAVLAALERDRFDGLALQHARDEAAARLRGHLREDANLDPGLHVLDVLWQHGLLGYEEDASTVHFYATSDVNDFHLPLDRRNYALHPCVAHKIKLDHVGAPVRID